MVRRCLVIFQCLQIWVIVGQGPIALAICTGGGVWTLFSLSNFGVVGWCDGPG